MEFEDREKIREMLLNKKAPKEIAGNFPYTEHECYKVIRDILSNRRKKIVTNSELEVEYSYKRMLFISDTHVGSPDLSLNVLEEAYLYADRRGITDIIHCGDLIEGVYKDNYSIQKRYEKQVENLLKVYPYESGVKTKLLLGNHDIRNDEEYLREILGKRPDIEILGKELHEIKLLDDKITLLHQKIDILNNYNVTSGLTFLGHYHKYMKKTIIDKKYIFLPSIKKSYKKPNGWLDVELVFEDGKITYHNIQFINAFSIDKSEVKVIK